MGIFFFRADKKNFNEMENSDVHEHQKLKTVMVSKPEGEFLVNLDKHLGVVFSYIPASPALRVQEYQTNTWPGICEQFEIRRH